MSVAKKISPELRFPEFTDNWVDGRIGTYLVEYREKSTVEDQHPVMTSSNKGLMLQSEYYGENRITDRDNVGFNVVPPNYITYRSRSDTRQFTFNINELDQTGLISVYYPVFRTEGMSKRFLVELLNSRKHYVGKYSVGTSQTVLSYNELCHLKFSLPSYDEQKKVAVFFAALERRIKGLEKQRDLLKDYKKGLMQQLFSQALRFTDDHGQPFPDWEEKRLGKFLVERKELATKSKGLPHISLTVEGVVPKTERYNRDFLVGDDVAKKYKVTRKGDLCYNPANLKFGVIDLNEFCDGIFSPIYVTYTVRDISPIFLKHLIKQPVFLNAVRRYEQGTVYERQAVHPSDFVKATIAVPSSEEQKKIADCLSALDSKIEQVEKQIFLTQEFKKGLLQKMFV